MFKLSCYSMEDYWSTDPTLCMPVFTQKAWLSGKLGIDITQHAEDLGRLFKIQPVYEYIPHKFTSAICEEDFHWMKAWSQEEVTWSWEYNPGKITKYGEWWESACNMQRKKWTYWENLIGALWDYSYKHIWRGAWIICAQSVVHCKVM
jgi:hypothetical protein